MMASATRLAAGDRASVRWASFTVRRSGYLRLLRSIGEIYLHEPVLRRRGLYGGLAFASFSTFWTAIAFQLAGHYHYSQAVIGLFGLLGVAGASCAQVAGRIADAGWGRVATAGFIALAGLSWLAIQAGGTQIAWMIVGILVLDLGVQGTHISNQSEVYRLRPEARSRLTTCYMVSYFVGGVTGSALAGAAYGERDLRDRAGRERGEGHGAGDRVGRLVHGAGEEARHEGVEDAVDRERRRARRRPGVERGPGVGGYRHPLRAPGRARVRQVRGLGHEGDRHGQRQEHPAEHDVGHHEGEGGGGAMTRRRPTQSEIWPARNKLPITPTA